MDADEYYSALVRKVDASKTMLRDVGKTCLSTTKHQPILDLLGQKVDTVDNLLKGVSNESPAVIQKFAKRQNICHKKWRDIDHEFAKNKSKLVKKVKTAAKGLKHVGRQVDKIKNQPKEKKTKKMEIANRNADKVDKQLENIKKISDSHRWKIFEKVGAVQDYISQVARSLPHKPGVIQEKRTKKNNTQGKTVEETTIDDRMECSKIEPFNCGKIITITYTNILDAMDPDEMKSKIIEKMIPVLEEKHGRFHSIKISMSCYANLMKQDQLVHYNFQNTSKTINAMQSARSILEDELSELDQRIENSDIEGSNNKFINYRSVQLTVMKNSGIKGGSSFIDTPSVIKDKKAVVNVKNVKDYKCFAWCIIAYLHPVATHRYRLSNYEKYESELKLDGLKFPLAISDIGRFEQMNPGLFVNVFGFDYNEKRNTENVYPLRVSEQYPAVKTIDLLYIESTDVDEQLRKKGHYTLITDFSRLARTSLVADETYKHICKKCINGFTSDESFEKHSHHCKNGTAQCVTPKEDKAFLRFDEKKNHFKTEKHKLCVFADFEACLQKPNEDNKVAKAFEAEHIVAQAAFLSCGVIDEYKTFVGQNCTTEFTRGLKDIAIKYVQTINQYPEPNLTAAEETRYQGTDNCWICGGEFSSEQVLSKKGNLWMPRRKVRDHDHLSGNYCGAAHAECNLQRRKSRFIPVFFHNLSRYDSHFIVRILHKFGPGRVTVVPHTTEEYISFSKFITTGYYTLDKKTGEKKWIEETTELRFLDSYRFLPLALDELCSILYKSKGRSAFKTLFDNTTREEQEVLFWNEQILSEKTETIIDKDYQCSYKIKEAKIVKPRVKGIYPYQFTDSFEKFNYNEVIPKEKFHDELNQKSISDQEYAQYLRVWQAIPKVTLGKYCELYLRTDICILADVFQSFREQCLECYSLDPCYFYTLAGYTYEACLKKTGVTLELLKDYDMLLMVEQGIRGGMSGVLGDRKVDVLGKNFVTNPSIDKDAAEQEWLLYIDCNNLYGWAMSQKMPTGGFSWLNETQQNDLERNIRDNLICGDEDLGYILDVDLTVPKSTRFENFPIAPEKKVITEEQLSAYSQSLLGGERYSQTWKLIQDFKDKTNYIIHIKTLMLYCSLGADFKINRVIAFEQSYWLKQYIDFNTEKRSVAANDFEKDFYKLMNNAMYGKTMENIRNRLEIKLCDSSKQALKYIRKPTFDHITIFGSNLVAVHMRKSKIVFNKPISVGFCVLELSKYHMFDSFYNTLQKMFKKVSLLYMDCDSFVLHIKDANIFPIMKCNEHFFDFCDYPEDHVLHSNRNKKVIGKFKDECNGNIMTKRISLKSKMYAHRLYNCKAECKRAKGLKKCIVRNDLNFDKYDDALMNSASTSHSYLHFESKNHQLYTVRSSKKGLSAFDSKRFYLDSNRNLPFQ